MSQNLLKDQLLITLSFFEPMSLEFIYLDLDKDFLKANPKLTVEDLTQALVELTSERKIKKSTVNKSPCWIKIYPKKSWLKRLKAKLPF